MPLPLTSNKSDNRQKKNAPLDQNETSTNQNKHILPTSASSSPSNRLAPFNPTSVDAQQLALKLFRLRDNDILFDLGCGDARFLISAVESFSSNDVTVSENMENVAVGGNMYGLRCVGIEYDPSLVTRANAIIEKKGLSNLIDVRFGDVMDMYTDIDNFQFKEVRCHGSIESLLLLDASAVFVYLLPSGLHAIKNLLENVVDLKYKQKRKIKDSLPKGNKGECKNESVQFRVVSYMFSIPGWIPTEKVKTPKTGCSLYLYDLGGELDSEKTF